MIKYFNIFFVTFFGIGKVKFAPGTLASLITILLLFYGWQVTNLSNQLILIILLFIFFYAFFAVAEYIKNNPDKDPKEVVIDEVIGQSIPIYLYEISHNTEKNSEEVILIYLYIFILFRYFDIKKPFPVSYFDRKLKNSLGVILDDVAAGLYVVLTLIIFMIVKSKFFSWTYIKR